MPLTSFCSRRLAAVIFPALLVLAGSASLMAGAQSVPRATASSSPPAVGNKPTKRDGALASLRPKIQLASRYGAAPLCFEQNKGQAKASALFMARGGAYNVALTSGEAQIMLPGQRGKASRSSAGQILRMKPAGMNPNPVVVGEEPLPGKVNYLIGNDPSRWHTDVSTFAKVRLKQVYPGVDMVYYGNQQQLEYDFIVQPGANAARVALNFEGAQGLRVAPDGDLLLRAAGREVRWKRPVAYQMENGKRQTVAARYTLGNAQAGTARVGLEIARYDHARPLVIDPTLIIRYQKYFNGTGGNLGNGNDEGDGVAVDSAGNTYIVGYTASTNLSQTNSGGDDAFVTKLDSSGNTIYLTLLGGSAQDRGNAIAIDGSGNAYITGITQSSDFPKNNAVTNNVPNGGTVKQQDAFVAKLNSSGTLVYSTYLGGGSNDSGRAIAVDSNGTAYVTGSAGTSGTSNIPFPTTANAYDSSFGGGGIDAYLAKLTFSNSTLTLAYSSYFGGTSTESGAGVDVEATSGIAYVVGGTRSDGFPTTSSGYDTTRNGTLQDAFLIKVDTTLSGANSLLYGTFFGGGANDGFTGVVLRGSGIVDMVGSTASNDFPTHNGYATTTTNVPSDPNFVTDAVLVELDTTQSGTAALRYSTYFGGSGDETATGIALDTSNKVYITGYTTSSAATFPLLDAAQSTNKGGPLTGYDAFAAKFDTGQTGNGSLIYSTFLGTTRNDFATGIGVDGSGNAYITGYLENKNADNSPSATGEDAFIIKIGVNQPPVANNQSVTTAQNTSVNITLTASSDNPVSVAYAVISPPSHGSLTGAAPNLTYTPNAGYFGPDSFQFDAVDVNGGSAPATVSITVVGKPTANGQNVTTNQDTGTAITLTGSDPNSPARSLTYTVTNSPAHGTLTGTAPNLTYTPTAGYFGSDSFKFTVNNGYLDSDKATVSITVVGKPTANSQSVTTNQDTGTAVTLTGSDPNSPARSLTYTVTNTPAHGTLSGTGSNRTYTPDAGYFGSDSFKFTVNNGALDSDKATVSITVVGKPTANAQSVTMNQDTSKAITLTGSDPNSPARSLTYTITTSPAHGTLTGTAPNLTYTPDAGYFGADSFQFKVSNGALDSSAATVSITVNQVITGPTDVSAQVTVTRGVFVYDRTTQTYSQIVTLTNTGNTAISGPISLILSSLTNATLTNKTGTTSAVTPAGRPYIDLPAGSLAASGSAGDSATITLKFSKTGTAAIAYSTQVVAGSGSR